VNNRYDVLIIGTGIAGLSLAIYLSELAPKLSIGLMSKGALPQCNTRLAQGGIAAVTNQVLDSFISHEHDTLKAGSGLCNPEIVHMAVHEAPTRVNDLVRWGVLFDANENGFHLNREGGHSANRIVHHKDFTGKEIHAKLAGKVRRCANVALLKDCFATELLLNDKGGIGLKFVRKGDAVERTAMAPRIALATGGSGQMFAYTTNHPFATADGLAMAMRAGARVEHLQYYQFHPTAMYQSRMGQVPLISEAVRGYGAHVVDGRGRRFLFDYDQRGELATRDVVTDAIYDHLSATGEPFAHIKVNHLDLADFKAEFPTITTRCQKMGIDLAGASIPVLPAAHYQCGGIQVDAWGMSSIDRVYALGECAGTGLHGANRLASNSLMEAVVFARRTAVHMLAQDFDHCTTASMEQAVPIHTAKLHRMISEKRRQLRAITTGAYRERNNRVAVQERLYAVNQLRGQVAKFGLPGYGAGGELTNLLWAGSGFIDALYQSFEPKEKHLLQGQTSHT
jgi:L-aspartate oxidase